MKTFWLFTANLIGTIILADFSQYLRTSDVIKLVIGLLFFTAIACFCWFKAKSEKSGWFYVFVVAVLALMDVAILADSLPLMSYMAEVASLFVLNTFIYWVLEGILYPDSDEQKPPEEL